ncbi:MAG: hypothetical protein IKH16_07695, partial [Selenomonadaceae bacterium]|nr:hypothetical protein [Selenomonadaceae bacterium]
SYEIRKPNPLREAWQADENDMLMLRIQKEYDGLLGHFREGFPKITGRKFWDGYLGISPKEELSASPVIEEHIHVEDGIDLLVALEDAILWMNSETLPIEQMGDAVREAVHHQLVQALEHHFARQRKEEAPEAEEIPQRRGTALHVSVKGMSEAASGMDFLEGMQEETLRKWQEDDTDFLREAARFHGAHGASEKNVAFLKECLENAARRYSDYRNVVVVEERE